MMKSGHESVSSATFFRCMILSVYDTDGLLNSTPPTGDSTRKMLNRPFLQLQYQHSSMPSWPLKNYMLHGRRPLPRLVTRPSSQPSLLGWQSSTPITNEV